MSGPQWEGGGGAHSLAAAAHLVLIHEHDDERDRFLIPPEPLS